MKGLKGLGEGSRVQNFQLLIPLVSSQEPGGPASHLPAGAPLAPRDAAAVGESGPARGACVPAAHGSVSSWDSRFLLWQVAAIPHLRTWESLGGNDRGSSSLPFPNSAL